MQRAEVAMLRALLWKEWREQRSLVLAGLALAALLPLVVLAGATATSGAPTLRRVAEVLPVIFAVFLWPLAALASGASVFAEERSSATSGFLLSRPVRRPLIWMAKVLLAAFATALIVAGSMIVALGVHSLAGGAATMAATLASFDRTLDAPARAVFGPAPLLLAFAAAIYFSTHRSRPLTATISGLLASLLLVSLIATTWPLVALEENVRDIWFAIEISVAATLLLIVSGRRFASEEALSATSKVKALVPLAGIGLLTVLLGFVPAIHADVFADWKTAPVVDLTIDVAGASIIVEAGAGSSIHGAVWRLGADGEERRLTGRLAFDSFVSPDGRWIYYFSQRRLLGLAGRRADLRAVRADGGNDRLIARDLGLPSTYSGTQGFGQVIFSPSGSKVLPAYPRDDFLVADLEQGRIDRIDLGVLIGHTSDQVRAVRSLAWIDETEVLLLGARSSAAANYATLVRYDLATRQARVLHEERDAWMWGPFPDIYLDSIPAPRKFPIVFRRSVFSADEGGALPDSVALLLVDLETGAHEEIASYSCGVPEMAMAASGRALAFTRFRCQVDAGGDWRFQDVELYLRDLETGQERGPLPVGGRFGNLRVSPAGDRAHVSVWESAGASRSRIIERDGTYRDLSVLRRVGDTLRGPDEVAWLDGERLFLFYGYRSADDVAGPWLGPTRIVIIDANTGAVISEHLWE